MVKPNAVRIVRCDRFNVAVERLVEVEVVETGPDGKRSKTGQKREEWQETGYYGHRIEHAAEEALFEAMPIGGQVTPQMVKDAVAEIVRQTKEHLALEKK